MLGILATIMTLYGLGTAGYLAGAGVKSLAGSSWEFMDIKLKNMEDPGSGMKVVDAYENIKVRRYFANVYSPATNETKTVSAASKKELEQEVNKVYKGLR